MFVPSFLSVHLNAKEEFLETKKNAKNSCTAIQLIFFSFFFFLNCILPVFNLQKSAIILSNYNLIYSHFVKYLKTIILIQSINFHLLLYTFNLFFICVFYMLVDLNGSPSLVLIATVNFISAKFSSKFILFLF